MYESFYGLKERPFELTPNPRFLCRTPRHREALSNLEYGISTGRGITLLIGEAGTGKTTLIRTALDGRAQGNALYVSLANPTLSRAEFVHYLAHGFGLSAEAAASKSVFLQELETLLNRRRDMGLVTALVIDEAQSLPYDLIEEVRLLANIETNEEKLLPVVLAGQPELADRLNEPSLRQLKQRVALRCTLAPLDIQETAAYIASRIRVAGGDSAKVFTREAVQLIHAHSGGIPRTISVICDNALVSGFALGERPVSSRLVREVCEDFDLARTVAGAGMKIAERVAPERAGVERADVDGANVDRPDTERAATPPVPSRSADAPVNRDPAAAPRADATAPPSGLPQRPAVAPDPAAAPEVPVREMFGSVGSSRRTKRFVFF